jgi:hypothetical protein
MKLTILSLCFLAVLSLCPAEALAERVRLIFDTDIGNDVDDALALGMIHALESRGECELLAVTITKDHPLAAPFVDAVNTFYGRGDIPIGMCRSSGVTPDEGKFNGVAKIKDAGAYRFPHDLESGSDAPSAVEVLRRALARSEDQSVVIAQVGFSTNLADLLQSPGDAISPLDGKALVRSKVRLVSIMAGAFQKIPNDKGELGEHQEYNVAQDIPSIQKLVELCEAPMVWSGFEIGLALTYPHQSILNDYGYVPHHPLPEAYIAYLPPPHDRPTWDLTSVLYAVRPEHGYFDVSGPGAVRVADSALTQFEESPKGLHRYLKLNPATLERTREALVLLSSQPPSCRPPLP